MHKKHLRKYTDYIMNTGNRISVEDFDEDWDPIGSIVRKELVAGNYATLTDGYLSLMPDNYVIGD